MVSGSYDGQAQVELPVLLASRAADFAKKPTLLCLGLFFEQCLPTFDFSFNFIGCDVVDLHGSGANFAPGRAGQCLSHDNFEDLSSDAAAVTAGAGRKWRGHRRARDCLVIA